MYMQAGESDFGLLDRYRQAGDQEAFAEIVRRYAAAVFTTAMRILSDRARADDVSQETFFRLSQKPEAVQQSLGGWLHTAATRLAIDAARSESSRAHREAGYVPRPASEATAWSDISPHVDRALAELPPEARLLLVGHFLQGKSQTQLAGELKTSPATVSRKMKSGVEMLRDKLKAKGVIIAAALLATLLRDHGAVAMATPAELMAELGKITMLSGRTGQHVAAGALQWAGGFWWTMAIAVMAGLFALVVWMMLRGTGNAPSSERQHHSVNE